MRCAACTDSSSLPPLEEGRGNLCSALQTSSARKGCTPHQSGGLSGYPPCFFWHGWRRHVCRGCTGHLMLVKRVTIQVAVEETPSTDTEEPKPKPPNNTTTKQQTKNQPPGNNCTWCATQAAKSTKMREGETGAMNSAFALSTSLPQRAVDQQTSDSSNPLSGDLYSRSVMHFESGHIGRAPC